MPYGTPGVPQIPIQQQFHQPAMPPPQQPAQPSPKPARTSKALKITTPSGEEVVGKLKAATGPAGAIASDESQKTQPASAEGAAHAPTSVVSPVPSVSAHPAAPVAQPQAVDGSKLASQAVPSTAPPTTTQATAVTAGPSQLPVAASAVPSAQPVRASAATSAVSGTASAAAEKQPSVGKTGPQADEATTKPAPASTSASAPASTTDASATSAASGAPAAVSKPVTATASAESAPATDNQTIDEEQAEGDDEGPVVLITYDDGCWNPYTQTGELRYGLSLMLAMRSALDVWPAPRDLDRNKCKMILPAQPPIRKASTQRGPRFAVAGRQKMSLSRAPVELNKAANPWKPPTHSSVSDRRGSSRDGHCSQANFRGFE